MITGEQLLRKLLKLTPEEREKPVVVEGDEGWFYNARNVELIECLNGRQINEDQEEPVQENYQCIAITGGR